MTEEYKKKDEETIEKIVTIEIKKEEIEEQIQAYQKIINSLEEKLDLLKGK